MSGIDDLLAESNDRWADAMRRAQGVEDNGLGEAVKTYYTRYFPAGFFILVAAGTIGGSLAFPGTPERWPTFLTFGFLLGFLGALIGGLVYNAKKVVPAAKLGRIGVLLSLENEEKKQVRRQIAAKASIGPENLSAARAAAVQLRKGLATQLVLAPLYPLIFIPQVINLALRGDSLFAWLMATGVVVVVVVGVGFLARDFRRACRFLTRTAEQTAPGNAPL
ncbi:hypothetical protein GCM10023346_04130 [Arthrobacter gyeryongensis]|uniref:Uncharacterized protein n=1 Tax=Arthrobacter gyeryongensis TaxID=1650592 RepID=A0ABP9S1Y7_9MICC